MAPSTVRAASHEHSNRFRVLLSFPESFGRIAGVQWQCLIFFIAFAAVVSRRPDAVFNAQFFAEDGVIWYRQAYTLGGFKSFLQPLGGYFQSFPRLAASLALLVPLRYAPLVMNLIGITFQVLPVLILLSWRCADWAPLSVRVVMSFVYIALPNTAELHATVTNGQWHLALLACLLVLARGPGRSVGWKIFDLGVILLSGLSGPFCILLLPIAVIFWWKRREKFRLAIITALASTSAIQIVAILRTASAGRSQMVLGATPKLFVELLAGRVYLAALIGERGLGKHTSFLLLAVVAVLGTAAVAYSAIKASLELSLFIFFAALVFAVSLKNPTASFTIPQWQALRVALGARYWFFPMLAFAWALIACTERSNIRVVRVTATCCLICMVIGIARDWRYHPWPDLHFPQFAERFARVPAGSSINIPIYPAGWMLQLTKKSGADGNGANSRH